MLPQLITIKSSYYLPTTQYSKTSTNNVRRSANFQPSSWRYDYIQSLRSEYGEESKVEERDVVKEEVRVMISKMEDELDKLEVIDVLQKLGVAAHFRLQIRNTSQNVYNNKEKDGLKRRTHLHATALQFRLLRQHGYPVSSEIFRSFQDDEGKFKKHLSVDIMGMLSLYEASFHSVEGEIIFDEARDFCSTYLKEFVKKNEDNEMSILISRALELPLHWRVPRLESRWFIEFYERGQNISPALLKLAKLDFNIVQATHQEDLKYISRWWKGIGLREKLSFARDRPMESFFWAMNMAYQPDFGYFRREMTKLVSIINTLDDIYDVYGTLEELQLFTDVVDRWDVNAIDILPGYMKICFLALYNFVNEEAFHIVKQSGYNIIPYLKKGWGDLCKSYMIEAKWCYNEYTPSLQEYLENAWISGGGAVALVQSYFLISNSITQKDLDCLQQYPNLIRLSATVLRLANDLASYKREIKIGDVTKSIECYMNETGASEAYARKHVSSLMLQTWKKMNEEVLISPFSQNFIEIALNMARIALCIYQHGDVHTIQDHETMNLMLPLLIQPIPITDARN